MANQKSICPVAGKCGGCQLLNLSYDRQLSFKQAKVIKLLGKFCHVREIIGMEKPFHYRNKVQAAFGTTRGGQLISGVYQSGSHRIVKVDSCLLEDEKADAIIVTVRKLLKSFRLSAYNEFNRTGFLRHVLVKRAFATGEIMVVLVSATPIFPGKNSFVSALRKAHPEITTVVHNVNDRFTSLVLGDRQSVLYGDGYITDVLCGLKFRISAQSFYQINPLQTEVLYNTAMEYASLNGEETVVDAYCGVGTIGMIAAKSAGHVVGVESNPQAVRDAVSNAKLNNMQNIRFVCADATDFLCDAAANGEHCDVLLMDPPRAGSTPQFIDAAAKLAPDRIVYVSCNPETLARDLLLFVKKGYAVKKIQPVDMFPHTDHVETVVLLVRKNADTHTDGKSVL